MSTRRVSNGPTRRPTRKRVFVTLTVADQLCGVPVLGGARHPRRAAITRIPLAPPEIAGSLNLRGRIVTAIDLRRRLRLPPRASRAAAHVGGRRTGRRTLRAAGRSGVRGDEPQGQRIRAQSADAAAAWAQFSTGIYRLEGRLLVVLDVGKLLALERSGLRRRPCRAPAWWSMTAAWCARSRGASWKRTASPWPRPAMASRRWTPAARRCRTACCWTGTCR